MAIRFVCPFGHSLVVPEERAGKRGRCPVCNQRVVIPRPDEGPGARDAEFAEVAIEIDRERRGGAVAGQALDTAARGGALPEPVAPGALRAGGIREWPTELVDAGPGDEGAQASVVYLAPTAFRRRGFFAIGLAGLATATMMAPAFGQLAFAAPWTWGLLFAGVGALVYLVWAARLLDWSTLWIGTWVFGGLALAHGGALAMALLMERGRWPLGLASAAGNVAGWAGVLAVMLAAVALVFRIVARPWREDYESFRAPRGESG